MLSYDADPNTGKPPLLLIHGFLTSRKHWIPNSKLSEKFRVIRIDLPAHGSSAAPISGAEAAPEVFTLALDKIRRELKIDRWHICGQSFGAGLSLRYAMDFPDNCIGHVFTNANAAFRREWTEEVRQGYIDQATKIREGGYKALRKMAYHPAHARRFPASLRALLCIEADRVDPNGFAHLLETSIPQLSCVDRLETLQVPTLLINGTRERRFQETRLWLETTQPKISIVDLEGGHSINIECPDAFNHTMTKFLVACEGATQEERV